MVKFGKYLNSNIKEEWRKHYIDYNKLKISIKELRKLQKENGRESILLTNPEQNKAAIEMLRKSFDRTVEHRNSLDQIFQSDVGKYISEFLGSLDNEIKKFTSFFNELEKNTYDTISSSLQLEKIYHELGLNDIIEEIEKLEKVANNIIDLTYFININVTALRKILKKFDKKFKLHDHPIALLYLRKNLSSESGLIHILQFKIIDESSALLEKLIKDIEKLFQSRISELDSRNKTTDFLIEPLLREVNLANYSNIDEKYINHVINSKIKRINELIEKIDDSNNLIRSNIEIWSLIIKSNVRVIQDRQMDKNQELIAKLAPQVKSEESHLSPEAKRNIWIVLTHTFIYTANTWIVQPTNSLYIKSMNANEFYTGIIMGITPFGALFSTILYSYWTNFSYKSPLIFSSLCFILGNFLYSYADNLSSVIVMGVGRFLVGFAGGRVINRRYLIEKVPKELILYYSLIYIVMTCVGMSLGPGFAMLLLYLPDYDTGYFRLNTYTYPSWFSFVAWIVFLIVIIGFFDESVCEKPIEEKIEEKQEEKRLSITEPKEVNLVDKEINLMLKREDKSFSYLGSAFLILIMVLFVIRMVTECMLVLAPLTIPYDYGWTLHSTAFFFQISALTVLPMCKLIDYLSKQYKERLLMLTLLALCLISSIFLTHYLWPVSVYQYVFFYTLLFICTNLLESVTSALLAKIFPNNESFKNNKIINSGFIIIMATTGGKVIGSSLVTVFGKYGYDNIQNFIFLFYGLSFSVLVYVTYKNYDQLRVKAIARIKVNEEMKNE